MDELSHASIIDGSRLSLSKTFKFKHNSIDSLDQKLRNAQGQKFVVTESIFSMDGSEPNLKELKAICQKNDAILIIDEAHSLGIKNFSNEIADIRIVTYGKAMGYHGAAILGTSVFEVISSKFLKAFYLFHCSFP